MCDISIERLGRADVAAGWVVILNGVPRSGKSSLAVAMLATFEGRWVNLGVDAMALAVSPSLRPGIGLRPGGERPDLEDDVASLYGALFESVAAFSRLGLSVAVDVGIHDSYSRPLGIWREVAARLDGLPVLVVGVRCPLEVIRQRRAQAEPGRYVADEGIDAPDGPVMRWQQAVHTPGIYDLEVDTAASTPEECAAAISVAMAGPTPTALGRLAG